MKKLTKQSISAIISVCLCIPGVAFAEDNETIIKLSNDNITVNSTEISTSDSDAVYLDFKTEMHGDVTEEYKGIENKIITISDAGTYRVSGQIENAQLAVMADEADEVKIILDGADITCNTAPAIMIYSAKETSEPGKSGVTLYLEENSENNIKGSHTARINDTDEKYDAAISSHVSLTIDGSGILNVDADNEGIEVKYKHLTINNGDIHVLSCDDPINGSEDGIAHITINGGWIFCSSEKGKEGDGIDSNGYITINGGTLIALGNPNSPDGGLDSDMGTTINGGTVIGAGNMYDMIDSSGKQLFMYLQFADSTDDILCITDSNGNPVFAYDFPFNYGYISFSSPALSEGIYHVSLGGEIQGDLKDGLYTTITDYANGTTLYHGGISAEGNKGGMRPPMNFGDNGERPEGMERPERPEGWMPPENMELPEGWTISEETGRPVPPEGWTPPEGMDHRPMGGGRGPGHMEMSAETSTSDFLISKEKSGYTNVTSDKDAFHRFIDVPTDAWFYNSVEGASQKGWLKGVGDNKFAPDNQLTGAEWITILARLANQNTDSGANWYEAAVNWGTENKIIKNGDWEFDENAAITREQMADMIEKFATVMGIDTSDAEDLDSFDDYSEISEYATDAFGWAVGAGVLQGDGTSLHPSDNLRRCEAAEVLMKLYNIMLPMFNNTAEQ